MKKYLLLITAVAIFCLSTNAQTVLGVDVYHGNSDGTYGAINWPQVRADGKSFAWSKASQGISYTDPAFVTNMTAGHSAGVVMGAYHFATPESNTAAAEANHFLAVASPYIQAGYLPPVLDLEDPPGGPALSTSFTSAQLTTWVQDWMTAVQTATGVAPILYTDGNYAGYLNSSLNTYGLWIADPNGTLSAPSAAILGSWTTWKFKQYSWTGTVTGIGDPNVDLDLFNGDTTALNTLINGGASTACSPATTNDYCHGPPAPQALTQGTTCSYVSGTTCGATQSMAPSTCSGLTATTALDVWYSFTATDTSTIVSVQSGTTFDAVVEVQSTECGTSIQCSNATGQGGLETINLTGLTIGTVYYIRVYDFNANAHGTTFQICVSTPTVSCTAPSAPTASSPGSSSAPGSAATISPALSWATVSGASGYDPRISQCPYGSANIIWNHSCAAGNSIAVTPSLPAGNLYRWNLDASCDCAGTISAASNTLYFNIPPVITYTGATTFCSGSALTLTTTAGNTVSTPTYHWYLNGSSVGSNSASYSATQSGSYTVAISYSCGSTDLSTPVVITVNPLPSQPGTISGPAVVCTGTTVTYSVPAVSGLTYSWSLPSGWSGSSTSDTIVAVAGSTSGTISVSAVNSCGPSASASSLSVTAHTIPSITAGASAAHVCPYQPVTFTASGATAYSWSGTAVSGSSASVNTSYSSPGTYTVTVTGDPGLCSATATATVIVDTPPSVTAGVSTSPVCADQQVSFTATGANTYSWSGTGVSGQTTSTASASFSSSGSYTVTVTAYTGICSATASTSVTVNAPPSVSANVTASPACINQQVSFIAAGGATYLWSGTGVSGQSTSTATAAYSSPATYTVTVTGYSGNNCSATASASVTVDPSVTPTVSISPIPTGPFCSGNNSISFTASGSNTGSNPLYHWSASNGQNANGTSFTLINLSSNITLSCTLTSNAQCASPSIVRDSVSVQVAAPSSPAVNISASASALCINSPVTFTASITGGPSGVQPSGISWILDGSPAGSGSPYTFAGWSSAGGHTVSCTVTYPSSACVSQTTISSANTLTINVQTQAPAGISIIAAHPAICQNYIDTFTAFASNGGSNPTYHWTLNGNPTGSNNAVFISSALNNNDIVKCFLTSNSLCAVPDTSSSNPVTQIVNSNPLAMAGNDTTVCTGAPIILTGSGGVSCAWSPSAGLSDSTSCSPICTATVPQVYTLTVTDQNGCKGNAHVAVGILSPVIPVASDSLISITISGSGFIACLKNTSLNYTSVKWDFGDGQDTSVASPCHAFTNCGPDTVTLTAYYECGSSIDSNSTRLVLSCPLEINQYNGLSNVKIVPNPSSGKFVLLFQLQQSADVSLKIFDMMGQIVQSINLKNISGRTEKEIDLTDQASGLYILQLSSGQQINEYKIEVFK